MGLLVSASGSAQLLSEKWRRTVVLVCMLICITALGIVGILIFEKEEILGATVAVLMIYGRRALGLKNKQEKQLIEQSKQLGGEKEKER